MSDRVAQALGVLGAKDRRRRIGLVLWGATGGAAIGGAAGLGAGLAAGSAIHWPIAVGSALIGATLGGWRNRRPAADAEALARALDRHCALPETVLTIVKPLAPVPTGLRGANDGRAIGALGAADPSPRLGRQRFERWPLVAMALLLVALWYAPPPPDGAGSGDVTTGGGGGGTGSNRGGNAPPAGGQGGDTSRDGPASDPGESSPDDRPDTPEGPPPPTPPEPDRKPDQEPKQDRDKPPEKPGSGTGPLYQDPERTKVSVERVGVKSLFDDTPGARRTVLVPDAPPPPDANTSRRPTTGQPPADIAHADEAALAERIVDPAERETVRRFYELLRERSGR